MWEKAIYVGDNHGNLSCPKAEAIVQSFMNDWKPKWRVHLGDLWDFSALRRKAGPEERASGISDDYRAGLDFLDWYKPTHLLLGNHDYRLWRAADEFSEGVLADLCRKQADDAEDQLRKRKIIWKHYHVSNYLQLPMGGPKLLHGYRSTMYPAKATWENWGPSISGHVHKPDSHEARHVDGGMAMTLGCIADLDRLSYANHTPAKLGWRQGFVYGIHNTKTGKWQAWHIIRHGNDWLSPHGIL